MTRGWTLVPLALAALIGAHLLLQCGNLTEADDLTPALALAQSCSGETAWTALEECTAIGQVYARRSGTGRVTTDIVRRYSAAMRTGRRQWVTELDADGSRPEHWPESLSWDGVWRGRWLALLAHSRRVVAGEAVSPCEVPPDHYGAPGGIDAARAARAGWGRVDCGPRMRNLFWRRRR